MTILIKEEDRVVIASSLSYDRVSMSDADLMNEENSLIKIVDDKIYVFAREKRYSDVLMCDDKFLSIDVNENSIITDIVPYMMNVIKNEKNIKGIWKDPDWNDSLTIIKDNKVFDIDNTFYVTEIDDYVCRVNFPFLGYGVLDYTKGKPAEERIRKVLDAFSHLHKINLYPVKIYDTKSKTTEIWEK